MSATSAGFLHRGEAAGKCRVVRFALLRVAIRACVCNRWAGTSTDMRVRGLSCSARQVEGLKGTLPRNSSARLSRSRAAQRSDPGHLPHACLRSQTPATQFTGWILGPTDQAPSPLDDWVRTAPSIQDRNVQSSGSVPIPRSAGAKPRLIEWVQQKRTISQSVITVRLAASTCESNAGRSSTTTATS